MPTKPSFKENGGGYVLGWIYMFAVVSAPILLVAADLSLGPQFMTAYVEQTGLYNGVIADIIPWSLSIATTGFQYLLIRGVRDNGFWKGDLETKIGILVGVAVLIFDTATDVAGMTSWLLGPEVGMQVIPDEPDIRWKILCVMTIFVCAFNEFMLDPALRWATKKNIPATDLPNKDKVFKTAMKVRKIYRDFKWIAQTFAIIAVAILDVCLIVYFFVTLFEAGSDTGEYGQGLAIVAGAIGIGVFTLKALFYLMWRAKHRYKTAKRQQAREAKASRMETGIDLDSPKEKKKKDKVSLGEMVATPLSLVFSICGILLSIGGFTLLMYGPDAGIFPDDPSLAWQLLAAVIALLCGFYLPFTEMGYGKRPAAITIDAGSDDDDDSRGSTGGDLFSGTLDDSSSPGFGEGFGSGGGGFNPGGGGFGQPDGFPSDPNRDGGGGKSPWG